MSAQPLTLSFDPRTIEHSGHIGAPVNMLS